MIPHVDQSKADLEEDFTFPDEKIFKIKWYDRILLNRPLKVITVLLLLTTLIPVLVYRFVFFPSLDLAPSDGFSFGSCLVPRGSRLPCGRENITSAECHPQCCYDHHNNSCFHRYPSRFSYISTTNWTEELLLSPRVPTVPYASQRSLSNLRLSIDEVSSTHLSITFYHRNDSIVGRRIQNKNYEYNVSIPEINVAVNSTQGNIFNSARGILIASNNIWEMSFKITNETMYGLGEIPLKGDVTKILYNHEGGMSSVPIIFAKSNESFHGLLIEAEDPTEIFIKSDNQIVVRSITNWGLKFHLFVGPKPEDIMRDVMALIGVKTEVEYWMLGAHVCSEKNSTTNPLTELQSFIRNATTHSMPYDSHCGSAPIVFNTECNTTLVNIVNQGGTELRNAGKKFMPHVSPYIKYTSPNIPEEHNEPEIETRQDETSSRCFNDTLYQQHIILDSDGQHIYKGYVDNHTVVYPSYDNISEEFMQHLWAYNTDFDGIVLENNWPIDNSEKDVREMNSTLPYFNEKFEAVFNRTPRWNAIRPVLNNTFNTPTNGTTSFNDTSVQNRTAQALGEHYFYTHNKYSNEFIEAIRKIKGSVPTLTSSQFMNGNAFINRQSIPTSWSSLHKELIEASLGGISGHWYWSSPICGDTKHFNNVTQVRLCAKWYMAATYMPMIKIHSKVVQRDPLSFVGTDRAHMIEALKTRISLLPYFYTVLQQGPLLRPMFYQFPSSHNLTDLTSQFSVGDDLLIVPNLKPSQTHVHVWMPPGSWYEFWSGMKINAEEGEAVTMTTTEAEFLTLIRGGSIIVMQKDVKLNSELTRLQSAYSLIIALDCKSINKTKATNHTKATRKETTTIGNVKDVRKETDGSTPKTNEDKHNTNTTEVVDSSRTTCEATGKLYMTENMTIVFTANDKKLNITASGEDFPVLCNPSVAIWSSTITELKIYGLNERHNNYDDHRLFSTTMNLCDLQNINKTSILVQFVD